MTPESSGVDLTLIRWMLSLTPDERLDVLQKFVDEVEEIREYRARNTDPSRSSGPAQARS
jgi:hypothetical protein